jgi:hypothetical protein
MNIEKLFEDFPSEEELLDIIMNTSKNAWGNELVSNDINKWLNNFKGEVFEKKYEQQIALLLLSHFTYYNEKEVKHLCRVLYNDLLHLVVNGIDINKMNIEEEIKNFFDKSEIISSEQISGSGSFIAYHFRHENNLPMNLFNFSIKNINELTENIIVIDDVILTKGINSQMYKFFNKVKLKYTKKKFYLLTLVSSESSLNYLKTTFDLEIVSAIKLDNRDKAFHPESNIFSSFKGLIDLSKEFATYYGKKISIPKVSPLGFGDGQYTFGFFYNTPDNSLPIFWGQLNGWTPILRRYHKIYSTQVYLHNEKFI